MLIEPSNVKASSGAQGSINLAPVRRRLYIDNSNIFRGCKKSGWRPSYKRVCEFLTETEGPFDCVRFFASAQDVPRNRQARFYQALKNQLGFELHSYRLAQRRMSCPRCGKVEWFPTEKGVDVGLATHLLIDLINDRFDAAIIMSSDRDHLEAVLQVARSKKEIKVISWKWTLMPEAVQTLQTNQIPVTYLDGYRDQLEKPPGEVV